eukprot:Phypoly_transcript_00408.p1 GENE.Phypoly_transcript_00408~~Phypoly_transcript_00408.p1  ORF type:complete len:1623 (+),score=348.10 Phypoly_transcript_00408:62-4870(+)
MNKSDRAKGQIETDNNVKVCVRVRPSKPGELVLKRCITVNAASNAIILDTKPECKVFAFDYVADELVTQAEIFQMAGKPITDACMSGYNATIFAYGQTGSGKTWTIQGGMNENGDILTEQRGLIPRIFEYLFQLMKEDTSATYTCKCSFLEIYNEQITDLLSPSSTNLMIHENLGRGGYVEGLKEEVVQTAQGAYNVLMAGIANRHVGFTAMNAASSRSHSVLTLSLESRKISSDGLTHVKFSRLNLIDLAGSERQKTTDTVGLRLKEAGNINKSLSALGNVIRALVDVADGKPRHVHYRDSKLTYLLKDSLGGNSKTCIIATVSPADSCFGESLSTLKFAQRAKMIKNMAVVNENSAGSVLALQAEVRRLREELASVSGGNYSGLASVPVASQSGKFDRLMELEVLLSKSMDDNEELQQEKSKLEMRVNHLKVLCERKDNFVMNTKMVVRLREAQIIKLETRDGNYEDVIPPRTADRDELREEVKALRSIVELHPEVTRFAMENLELRDDIAKLDSMSDSDAQISDLKNHIRDLSAQLSTQIKEKHDLMKGDSDKEKTETIMALRMKLESNTMDLEEKNENINFLSAELERAKNEQICTEQALQQMQKEMAQKEHDIQEMMTLADEAFQQKNGSSEKMWMAKIQKLQEEFREKDAAHQQELVSRDETIARLRVELGQSQVTNRRLSSHFSFPTKEDAGEEEPEDFPPVLPIASSRRASGGFGLRADEAQSTRICELQSKLDAYAEEIAQLKEERDTFADEIKYLKDSVEQRVSHGLHPDTAPHTHEQEPNNNNDNDNNNNTILPHDQQLIATLRAEVADLTQENNIMTNKYSELQSQAFQYHIDRDELEESHKNKVSQLESELHRCKELISELQESGSAMVTDADSSAMVTLRTERDALQSRIEQTEVNMREESARLEAQLVDKEAELAQIKGELAQQATAVESLQKECGTLREAIAAKEEVLAKYHEEQQRLVQQCDQYASLHANSDETISKNVLEAQADELASVQALLASAQGREAQLQQQIEERMLERDNLQAEMLDKLAAAQASLTDAQAFSEQLQQQVRERTAERDSLQSEMTEKLAATQESSNERALVEQLQEEIHEITARRDSLQAALDDKITLLVNEQAFKEQLQEQLHERMAELEGLKAVLATAQASLSNEQVLKEHLQQELRERTAERDSLEVGMADKATTLGELQATLAHTHLQRTELEHELSAKAKQQEEAQQKIQELEQQCTLLQEEIESANELDLSNIYQRQLQKLQADHTLLQGKIQEIDGRAAEERAVAAQIAQQLREDKEGLEERIRSSLQDVQRLTEETSQLRENLQAATEEAARWKEEVAQANEKLRGSFDDTNTALELRENLRVVTEQAHKWQAEATQVSEKLRAYHAEASAIQDELRDREQVLRAELAAKDEQSELMKTELLATHAKALSEVSIEKEGLIARAIAAEQATDSIGAKLKEVTEKYTELLGHHNHNQKIKHTQQLKTEIAKLQEENLRLKQKISDQAKIFQTKNEFAFGNQQGRLSPAVPLRNNVLSAKLNDSLNSLNSSLVSVEPDEKSNFTTATSMNNLASMASPLNELRVSLQANKENIVSNSNFPNER